MIYANQQQPIELQNWEKDKASSKIWKRRTEIRFDRIFSDFVRFSFVKITRLKTNFSM